MSEFQRKLIEALKEKKNSQVNNTINDLSDEKENVGLFKTLSNTFNDIVRSFGNAGDFGGNYASGGGFAQSTINKDIIIVPTAGTAASQNTYSQIDFKFIANTDSRNNLDPSEVKLSLYNWGERVSGSLFDTPVLVVGGSWGNTTWAPNAGYGVGVTDSALAGYVTSETGTGNLIYIKPASSSIIAALFNNTGIDNDSAVRNLTFTAYSGVTPGARPTAGISVTFGGTGQSGNIVFGGASSNTQTNNIRFYSPLTVSNSTVTDTLSLSLTDSGSGSTQHFVGLGNIRSYNLASNSSSFNKGDIFYSGGTGHTHLARLPIGSDNNVLQAGNGTIIWTNSLNVSNVFASTALSSPLLTSPIHLTLEPNVDGAIGVQVIASTGATVATFDTTNKRVGIGLTNPNFGLTVAGFSDGIIRAGTAVSTPLLTSGTTLNIRPNVDNIFGVQIQTSTGATFVNFDTSNRRVGIGISNPSVDLDVRSFTGVGGTIRVGTAVSSPFIISQTIRPAIDRTDGVLIQAATGATVATFDTTNRRVGIGLTNPNFGLTVAGFSDGIIRAGTAVSTSLLVGSGNTLIIRPNVDNTFSIQIQTSTGATFVNFDTTNKRVGIGLSNPTYILDVVGDINAAVGQSYRLAGNVVLGPSTLGTGVTLSSLTQVGAITSGTWAGTAITTAYGGIGAQPIVNTGDILVGSGNTWYRLPISTTDNDVLTVNGADPFKVRWAAVPPAAASSVAAKSINDSGSRYLTFVSGPDVSGVGLSTDSDLIYDASTNRLQVGSLTGNGVTIGTAANTISAAGDLTLTSSTNNVTVNNNLSVTGNLIVNGTTTSIGSTITTLLDPVFVLGAGIGGTNPTVDDNKDRGIEFRYFSGTAKTGFFGYDDSTESFTFIPDATNSDEVFSGAAGTARFANVISNLSGNVTGNLTGFADTSNSVRVATTTANAFNPVLFTPSASSTGTAISANSMLVYNPGTDILYSSGIHVTSSTAVDNVVSAPFRINGGLGVSNNIVVVNGIGIGYSYSGHGGIGFSYRAKLFVDQAAGNAGFEIYDGVKSPNNPRILLQIDGAGGNIPGLIFRNASGSNASTAAIVGVPDSSTISTLTIWTSNGTDQIQRLNVTGGSTRININEVIFGINTSGTATTSILRGTNATGTNINSGEFRIIAGRSTGNAANEGVGIYVANPGASSSTLNTETLVTRFLGTGVTIVPNTSSSSVSTGSLVVNGGVGLAGNAFIGGTVTSTNTSASFSVGSGALVLAGGAGIAGTLTVGTRVNVTNSLNSSSSTTGAIINSGGLGLGGNAFIGGTVVILNTSNSTTINSGALEVDGGVGVGLSISIGGRLQLFNGNLYTAFYSTQSGVNTTYILPNTSPSATGTSVLSSTMDGILSWVPMTATGGTSNSIQSNDANANSSHYVLVSPSNTTTGIAVSTDSQLLYNPSTNTLSVSNIFGSGAGVTISNASSLTSNSYLTIQTVAADDSSTTDFFIRGITSGATSKFSVDANGNLRATTKSFDIPHPTKPGKRLVYGVLEGPEHGVYHRGTAEGSGNVTVLLPEYWSDLVGSNYTLQLTPYGNYNVSIFEKNENYFTIQLIGNSLARKYKKYKVDYILHGARKDAPLDIEQ